MNNELCKTLGIEFPLFAFSHCRDIVAEVTNAGGFGVLGAVGLTPETLEIQLNWIDEKVKGKPYGVDLLIPENMLDREAQTTDEELTSRITPEHEKASKFCSSATRSTPRTCGTATTTIAIPRSCARKAPTRCWKSSSDIPSKC